MINLREESARNNLSHLITKVSKNPPTAECDKTTTSETDKKPKQKYYLKRNFKPDVLLFIPYLIKAQGIIKIQNNVEKYNQSCSTLYRHKDL